MYYSIKASLEKHQAQSVTINLTPIKGKFVIFTSRKGKIPKIKNNDKISYDNTMELSYEDYEEQEEHIIGVALTDK